MKDAVGPYCSFYDYSDPVLHSAHDVEGAVIDGIKTSCL